MIIGIMRRFHPNRPIKNGRGPLIGFTANEAIEFIKTGMRRPAIIRAGNRNFPRSSLMIFAEGSGAVSIQPKYLRQRRNAVGANTGVAGKGGGKLHDGAGIVHMMVAAGEQGHASWRAQRSGMKAIIAQT